ncbi:hypothetical protein M0811_00701 [Anaeramoeba ignava]|uniref:Uncharacterized protein n=1 Tax=Anaeramoeba ignava TaxID=1746090 RepID=A0A9Q0LJS0_ANAIG|nr:hypothetical protein M0811_00701 [Anaeramoeba ignava]
MNSFKENQYLENQNNPKLKNPESILKPTQKVRFVEPSLDFTEDDLENYFESLNQKISNSEKQIQELNQELQQKNQEIEEKNQIIQKNNQEINKFKTENEKIQQNHNLILSKKIQETEQKYESLLKSLSTKMNELIQDHTKLEEQRKIHNLNLEKQNKQLREKLEKIQKENQNPKMEEISLKIDEMKKLMIDFNQKSQEGIMKELEMQRNKYESLKVTFRDLHKNYEMMKERIHSQGNSNNCRNPNVGKNGDNLLNKLDYNLKGDRFQKMEKNEIPNNYQRIGSKISNLKKTTIMNPKLKMKKDSESKRNVNRKYMIRPKSSFAKKVETKTN